jgi:hypothetical protein
VDGKSPQSLISTDLGWAALDAKYIGLGAGNTASAAAYDFRYDWFFSAKDLPDDVQVQVQAEQAAP